MKLVRSALLAIPILLRPPAYAQDMVLEQDLISAPTPSTTLGSSVAIQGNRAVLGAPNSKKAFVYERTGHTWNLTATLSPSNPSSAVYFGWSVAIDGDVIVVGDPGYDFNQTSFYSGAATVFRRSGSSWLFEAVLPSPDNGALDDHGRDVAVRGDWIVVGDYTNSTNPTSQAAAGAAFVYYHSGGTWSAPQKLLSPNLATSNVFGTSVSIDTNWIAIGEPGASGIGERVHMYRVPSVPGSVWTFNQTLQNGASGARPLNGSRIKHTMRNGRRRTPKSG